MGSRKLSVDKKWGEGGKPRLQENGEKAAKERRRRMESLVESAGKKVRVEGREGEGLSFLPRGRGWNAAISGMSCQG